MYPAREARAGTAEELQDKIKGHWQSCIGDGDENKRGCCKLGRRSSDRAVQGPQGSKAAIGQD